MIGIRYLISSGDIMIKHVIIAFMSMTMVFADDVITVSGNSNGTEVGTLEKDSFRVIGRFKLIIVPETLVGKVSVVANRGSTESSGKSFSFNVNKPVTVYILVDDRRKSDPEGWTKTEMSATWYVNKNYTDTVFKKDFPAGKIEIPASDVGTLPHFAVVE